MGKRVGKAAEGELTIVGSATPKARRPRRYEWTKDKEKNFLSALAETCNVTLAAQAAGMSTAGAYLRRKKVAAFRAAWSEAIAIAYQRLELAMLDRSLNGSEKIITRKDGSEERIREYPNAVALTLLRMHRETAAEAIAEPDPVDLEEVRERLFKKLQRLRSRR